MERKRDEGSVRDGRILDTEESPGRVRVGESRARLRICRRARVERGTFERRDLERDKEQCRAGNVR